MRKLLQCALFYSGYIEEVASTCHGTYIRTYIIYVQANTAQQLGVQMASMYYLDGEIVTVGTQGGKAYLNSHPAILATFQANFLYGEFAKVAHPRNGKAESHMEMTLMLSIYVWLIHTISSFSHEGKKLVFLPVL